MQLTIDQLQSLDHGQPVPLVVDGRTCVLLNDTVYKQVRDLLEDWHPTTMRRHMAAMMADDWNDPAMSVYDE
jgi:hypothetical protein